MSSATWRCSFSTRSNPTHRPQVPPCTVTYVASASLQPNSPLTSANACFKAITCGPWGSPHNEMEVVSSSPSLFRCRCLENARGLSPPPLLQSLHSCSEMLLSQVFDLPKVLRPPLLHRHHLGVPHVAQVTEDNQPCLQCLLPLGEN